MPRTNCRGIRAISAAAGECSGSGGKTEWRVIRPTAGFATALDPTGRLSNLKLETSSSNRRIEAAGKLERPMNPTEGAKRTPFSTRECWTFFRPHNPSVAASSNLGQNLGRLRGWCFIGVLPASQPIGRKLTHSERQKKAVPQAHGWRRYGQSAWAGSRFKRT